jgi:biopolymer transport protein ExbD
MITLDRRRRSTRLSLTPLIDVVFILLIFFMLESDFLRPYVMELAQQGGGQRDPGAKAMPVVIELHADESVWINKERHPLEKVKDVLQDLEPSPESPVVVAADPGVPLQRAVSIIDILHEYGLVNIAITEAQQFDK